MITPTTIYWIGQCDQIRSVLEPAAVISTIFTTMLTILLIGISFAGDAPRLLIKMLSVVVSLFGAMLFVAVIGLLFIPTTKTGAAMYVVPAIVNNEKINEAGDRLYELAAEWMEELRPAKNKNGSEK